MENIKYCKNCGKEHNGTFGSGIYCSSRCSHQFAGKMATSHNKSKIGEKFPRKEYICDICGQKFLGLDNYRAHKSKCTNKHIAKGDWSCPFCNEIFKTRELLEIHRAELHKGMKIKQHKNKIDFICEFCKKEFKNKNKEYKTIHQNHCEMNPNRVLFKGHKHTEEEKKRLSEIAKKNNFGGWHSSKRINYNGITLDSSYELLLAQDLDKNNIKWERPKPILYKLRNEEHRYYPDFYLSELNIYVDTKNDYLINNINPRFGITDKEKIKLVEEQNNIRIIILDKDNLSWESLNKLL